MVYSEVPIGIHAAFSGNSYQDLQNSGIEKIITCNTIPHPSNAIDISSIIAKSFKSQIN
jgi:ribose-phosphate pyrophosphokinase